MQRPALIIEGPYICGKGLAVNTEATTLATASWRADHPLQVSESLAVQALACGVCVARKSNYGLMQ